MGALVSVMSHDKKLRAEKPANEGLKRGHQTGGIPTQYQSEFITSSA